MDIAYADLLKELAAPVQIGDRVKRQIERASRLSGLNYWRVFDIWYGKVWRIDVREADKIIAAVKLKRAGEVTNDMRELRLQLTRLEAKQALVDSDLDRQSLDESSNRIRSMGRGYGRPTYAVVK